MMSVSSILHADFVSARGVSLRLRVSAFIRLSALASPLLYIPTILRLCRLCIIISAVFDFCVTLTPRLCVSGPALYVFASVYVHVFDSLLLYVIMFG